MLKKCLSILLSIGITTTLLNTCVVVKASSSQSGQDVIKQYVSVLNNKNWQSGQDVIKQYVSALNNKDWQKYSDFLPKIEKESFLKFVQNKTNQDQKRGIFDIKSASVKEIKNIPLCEIQKFIQTINYESTYTNLQGFLLGTNYNVYNENKYYFNGTNYDLILVGKLGNSWKIIYGLTAPLDLLREDGYGFFNKDENDALNVLKQLYKGRIVNKSGKLIGTIQTDKNVKLGSVDNLTANQPYNFNLPFPYTINVYSYSRGTVTNVSMYNYITDVLPNEWYPSWNIDSLKAGAMAIKMWAWWMIYHVDDNMKSKGADVGDNQSYQVWVPNSHNKSGCGNCNSACQSVYNWGIVNKYGNVFITQYCAKNAPYGWMDQNGSESLANSGYNYMSILSYYYNSAYGPIQRKYIGDNSYPS